MGLAETANGRDVVTAAEFARAICRAEQTVRKIYCLTGTCYGLRPRKVGNRLLWSVSEIAELISESSSGNTLMVLAHGDCDTTA